MTEKKLTKLLQSYGNISSRGALRYFCGPMVGSGLNREVYELKQDHRFVVKIQKSVGFDNVMEWYIWNQISSCEEIAKWFAQPLVINSVGTVLVQRRVEFRKKKDYPTRIPIFFTDLKIQNFGFIGDQLKCVDYGCLRLGYVLDYKKSRYAKWWNVNNRDAAKQIKKHRDKIDY